MDSSIVERFDIHGYKKHGDKNVVHSNLRQGRYKRHAPQSCRAKCLISIVAFALAVSTVFLTPHAVAEDLEHVHIVDDVAEWPPYLFYQTPEEPEEDDLLAGLSIDVVTRILERNNITFDLELLPFTRALKQLQSGKIYQLLLNASFVPERTQHFFYTLPYYTLRHVAFYSAKKYPQGLHVNSISDLMQRYKMCGLRGYSYGSAGIKDEMVNMNFSTYDQLIQVLHERQEVCDVFIEGYEILAGFKVTGTDYLADSDLKHTAVPGMKPKGYHMIISKHAYRAEALKTLLDQGITQLQASGEMDILLAKYFLRPH